MNNLFQETRNQIRRRTNRKLSFIARVKSSNKDAVRSEVKTINHNS